ncbi:bifunctional precorrin-2 dehydrogenase/sirohydrochlorin ferrochelatase [Sulfurimonas sp.]|uniref:precorrin-2 dehydrogenase/sirohydrochlorin ferrochelatase family protein n=1 Tax=Sulfurimonas sp. TaxID=2022749 RepID=UPI0025E51448|nr:bifunctional precorrin-2 dehydrogenase/sirohydrochlorin ferrochelatase [Sulfurimonas sp.]MBT5935468.1 bifunctional precorrin-2 dehydrogenase/sirohydrochlorin ferrochelatase [Sulfurimonas sp.]
MSYFPAFIELNNKRILLVGGGVIACEKLSRLLDFSRDIEIISLEFCDEMKESIKLHGLMHEQRPYVKGDIKEYAMVIVAVDDIPLQKIIYDESQNLKCLCNAVDSVDYCDFIFPSYIKEGDLTLAISTSGSSPAFAKYFKAYLRELIPSNISNFLGEMRDLRKILPKGKERMAFLDEKVKNYMNKIKS